MQYECKDDCLSRINDCPLCVVAYHFIHSELERLLQHTENILSGRIKEGVWTSPTGDVFLTIELSRGEDSLEQLNNAISVTFLSDRRIGLMKKEWSLSGKIVQETWNTIGVVDPEYSKFNTPHQIPITVYNNHFIEGFSFFVDSVIDWMHGEDYQLFKKDVWDVDYEKDSNIFPKSESTNVN